MNSFKHHKYKIKLNIVEYTNDVGGKIIHKYTIPDDIEAIKNQSAQRIGDIKYKILRRAICTELHGEMLRNTEYTREELEILCHELGTCTKKELERIHKKWIGY